MSRQRADGPSPAGLPAKLYFRIGEVAELVGVEPHVLRYWEREFRMIRPAKSRRGQRVYSRRDVEILGRIRTLLYDEGFTIAGAKRKLSAEPARGAPPALEAAAEDDALQGTAPAAEPENGTRPAESDRPAESERPPEGAAMPLLARDRLIALRGEIEAFLSELEPNP